MYDVTTELKFEKKQNAQKCLSTSLAICEVYNHWIMCRQTKMNLFLYNAYSYVLSSFYLNTVTKQKKKKYLSTYIMHNY